MYLKFKTEKDENNLTLPISHVKESSDEHQYRSRVYQLLYNICLNPQRLIVSNESCSDDRNERIQVFRKILVQRTLKTHATSTSCIYSENNNILAVAARSAHCRRRRCLYATVVVTDPWRDDDRIFSHTLARGGEAKYERRGNK